MDRQTSWQRLEEDKQWDLVIIGGGAVGLGVALDAVSRGYSVAVFEQHDFCKGTSSRSTKLIHGGVRYLRQGNIALVREALHERGLLLRNAPDLVQPLRFIVPCFGRLEKWYYAAGMKCYDALAGRLGIQASHGMSTQDVCAAIPGLATKGLRGGVAYYDAQFDDASLVIGVAKLVQARGGVTLNYAQVEALSKRNGSVSGVRVRDVETGNLCEVQARVVVNAAGVFSDEVRSLDDAKAPRMIAPSQGIHLVVDQRFLGGADAMMVPKTKDGRVLFAIPWLGRAVLGTTDTPVSPASLEPRPQHQEVSYLLEHFRHHLSPAPQRQDILSSFAGLRPLVKPRSEAGSTSKISREHRVITSSSGLVSILGGKWTTFRRMGTDVVDVAQKVGGLAKSPSCTRDLRIEAPICRSNLPDATPTAEQIAVAVDHEFARTVEDVLARRYRSLLLNARASMEMADTVAQALASRLGHSEAWATEQTAQYRAIAEQYCV